VTTPQKSRTKTPLILICPDSFKGSLSATQVANAMARGIRRSLPQARLTIFPMADGGEGSIEALAAGAGGTRKTLTVRGPLGRPVRASLLLLPGKTAVVEMAQAAGLLLVPPNQRKPLAASTYGVGQLISAAVRHGAKKVIVFTGGSATTDGGAGMAQALGFRLLDRAGKDIPPGGGGLAILARIEAPKKPALPRGTRVLGATDVRIPLLGRLGSARNFAPQKGATPREVALLEKGLANLVRVARRDLGVDMDRVPGAGSAGGTGAGLIAFAKASLVPGAPLVFDILGLDRHLAGASLVLTGEGNLDRQTPMGKLVAQLCARARRHRVPVIAIAGRVKLSRAAGKKMGLLHAYSLTDLAEKKSAIRFADDLVEIAAGWAAYRFFSSV
jgi:glycerate kinase